MATNVMGRRWERWTLSFKETWEREGWGWELVMGGFLEVVRR